MLQAPKSQIVPQLEHKGKMSCPSLLLFLTTIISLHGRQVGPASPRLGLVLPGLQSTILYSIASGNVWLNVDPEIFPLCSIWSPLKKSARGAFLPIWTTRHHPCPVSTTTVVTTPMHPAFQTAPPAVFRGNAARRVPLCSTNRTGAQTAASIAMLTAEPSRPRRSSPVLPPHAAVVWRATLPPLCAAEKLPHMLHTHFTDHFPSLSAAKRAVRRRELYLQSDGEWRLATVLDRPQSGDLIARAARVEMASVRARIANKMPELAMVDGFVRYVDEERQCAVVVKPAGVTTGAALREAIFFAVGDSTRRQESATAVVGAVLRRPVAVHRLDKVTGGLVMVALTEVAVQSLSEQFQRRDVRKTYRARVEGCLEVEREVVRAPVDGRAAETVVVVVGSGEGWTEVLLSPRTGRRHQLRVHMKGLGHPILFDTMYGAKEVHPVLGEKGICLWAEEIAFRHPTDGRRVEVKADPPSHLFVDLVRG